MDAPPASTIWQDGKRRCSASLSTGRANAHPSAKFREAIRRHDKKLDGFVPSRLAMTAKMT
jgi:hypothetical protein